MPHHLPQSFLPDGLVTSPRERREAEPFSWGFKGGTPLSQKHIEGGWVGHQPLPSTASVIPRKASCHSERGRQRRTTRNLRHRMAYRPAP